MERVHTNQYRLLAELTPDLVEVERGPKHPEHHKRQPSPSLYDACKTEEKERFSIVDVGNNLNVFLIGILNSVL